MNNLLNRSFILGLLFLLISPSQANAQRDERGLNLNSQKKAEQTRTALVIGNSEYSIGRLKNPINDARDVAQALREIGFEVI